VGADRCNSLEKFRQDGELEMSLTLPVKIADSERSDRRAGSDYLSGVLL
jgi:hypothetical protein